MGKFEVQRSMVRGAGLLSAPAFLCFPDEMAQARYVSYRPNLYPKEFVTLCRNKLRACSSTTEPVSSSDASSSASTQV